MSLPFRKKDRFAGTDRLDLALAVEFDLAFKNGEYLMFPDAPASRVTDH
jgi:hypothetical protein